MAKKYHLKYSNKNLSSFSRKILRKNIKTFFVKNPYAANAVVVNHFISRRLRKSYYLQ